MIHETNVDKQGGLEEEVRIVEEKPNSDVQQSAARIADWLVSSNRNFMFRLKSKLNKSGLSYQNYLLLEDLASSGPFIMKEIAEKLDVTVAAATGTIDRLTEQNYTRRIPCKNDRRKVAVEITDSGRNTLDSIHTTIQNQIASAIVAENAGDQEAAGNICSDLKELVDLL